MSTDYHRLFRHYAPDLNLDLDLNPNPNPKDWEIKIQNTDGSADKMAAQD
jgi:hypothetical protein